MASHNTQAGGGRDKDLEYLAGVNSIDKRHSTKRNCGPKLFVGEAIVPPGSSTSAESGSGVRKGHEDADSDSGVSYTLEEVPLAKGQATDARLRQDSRVAARLGIPTADDVAHMGSLLAGSNVGSRAALSPSAAARAKDAGARVALDEDTEHPDAPVPTTTSRYGARARSSGEEEGAGQPGLPLAAVKARTDDILRDFFVAHDYAEAQLSFQELMKSFPFFAFAFVYRLIRRALEREDMDREAACRLLSRLSLPPPGAHTPSGIAAAGTEAFPTGNAVPATRGVTGSPPSSPCGKATWHVLTMKAVGQGFERVLAALGDIQVDVPKARDHMARFLARAVSDEILPPAFLDESAVADLAPDVISTATALLSGPHVAERLEHAWAVTGACTVDEMKEVLRECTREYFTSRDASGVVEAVRELSSPHFSHEVVYRTIVAALDRMGSLPTNHHSPVQCTTSDVQASEEGLSSPVHKAALAVHDRGVALLAVALLKALRVRGLASDAQILKGADRAREALADDLVADDPRAEEHLELLLGLATEAGVLPATRQ